MSYPFVRELSPGQSLEVATPYGERLSLLGVLAPSGAAQGSNPNWISSNTLVFQGVTYGVWYIDPQNSSGNASDSNPGSLAAPLLTYQQLTQRWGTTEPIFRVNTAVIFLSSHPINPAVDEVKLRWRIQNGAQCFMAGTLTQVQTGTLGAVVAINRSSPGQRLTATLGAGLSQPTLIKNTTHGGFAWIDTNTGGNTWTLTEPANEVQAIPPSGNGVNDTWATNDAYVAFVPTIINIRYCNFSWEDITDGSPDSRPTLYACTVGQGINSGAGVDTAMVRMQIDGTALYQVAIISSTSIVQKFYPHGSRAEAVMVNCFASDNSARTNVVGILSTTSQTASGEGKLISIVGGRMFDPIMTGVVLSQDFTFVGSGRLSGLNLFDNICIDGNTFVALDAGHAEPLSGGSTIWGAGGLNPTGGAVWVVNSPAATFAGAHNGFLFDGQFAANALDDTVTPARWISGVQFPGSGGPQLDLAIASGGCGGRAIGRNGSMITVAAAQTSTPIPSGPQLTQQVTTANAVATTGLSYTLAGNKGGSFRASITARNTATNRTANALVAFGAQNVGGVTILGTPTFALTFANGQDAAMAGVAASIVASGNNIVVQVTGLAATNIQWTITLEGVIN